MRDRLSAIQVVAGLGAAHGGPSYSVPRLCKALAGRGVPISLLSVKQSREHPPGIRATAYEDARYPQDFAFIPGVRKLRLSSGLLKALRSAMPSADIIHNHGLWLMPNVYAGWEASRSQKPLVVSPRGMLSAEALAFSPIRKKIFWFLLQKRSIRRAACIHVTSTSEYEDVRALGLTNPVAVIPNGVDIPVLAEDGHTSKHNRRILLSLGRIHPKKGLDGLLHAWAKIECEYPTWRLRIVGPGEANHEQELQALARALSLHRVTIEGPIYGNAKRAAYSEADLFVLPSLNENFGITVAESLASGTPVISSKGTPWSGLAEEGCGWWVDHEPEALAAALANAMSMPSDSLRAMGAKGRAWMARDFSWDQVARDMLELYLWLSGRGEKPMFVSSV